MCGIDPVSMGLAAVSTGMQMYSQNAQQDAQAQMEQYQAQVAANNQAIAQNNEQNAINQGQQTLYRQQIKNSLALGSARAQMAANGLDLSMGTPLDVLDSTETLGNLDAANIRNATVNQANGYAAQAMNLGAQSQMDQYKSDLSDWSTNMGLANAGIGMSPQIYGGINGAIDTLTAPTPTIDTGLYTSLA